MMVLGSGIERCEKSGTLTNCSRADDGSHISSVCGVCAGGGVRCVLLVVVLMIMMIFHHLEIALYEVYVVYLGSSARYCQNHEHEGRRINRTLITKP
jgi:hypothetical protein